MVHVSVNAMFPPGVLSVTTGGTWQVGSISTLFMFIWCLGHQSVHRFRTLGLNIAILNAEPFLLFLLGLSPIGGVPSMHYPALLWQEGFSWLRVPSLWLR